MPSVTEPLTVCVFLITSLDHKTPQSQGFCK